MNDDRPIPPDNLTEEEEREWERQEDRWARHEQNKIDGVFP